jgi:Putative Flp pilus-assembly TadE/G-like
MRHHQTTILPPGDSKEQFMLKRFANDESGQVLVLTVLTMTLLMGMMALAIDVGLLFRARRVAQTAADAGAMAGALEWNNNGTARVVSAARAAARNNGITNTSTNVHVHMSPNITSPYHNTSGFVEVVVSQPNPTFFMAVFNFNPLNVTARGVAGIIAGTACIIALDRNNDDSTLLINAGSTITTPNCGIQVDSSSSSAFCDQGNATIDAPYIRVSGNEAGGGNCGKSPGTPLFPNAAPISDPYANLPDPNSLCAGGNTTGLTSITTGNVGTLPSSRVTQANGTIANVTCFSGTNVNLNGITLGSNPDTNADLFVFQKGVTLTGTVNVNGTMDVAGGTFNQGTATLNINAPGFDNSHAAKINDTYNSIGLMQGASNIDGTCQDASASSALKSGEPCLQVQSGSGSGQINGVIYAPTSMVYLKDPGGSIGVAGVISYSILVNSQLSITNSYFAQNPDSSPLSSVQLVE